MLNVCVDVAASLSLTFNASKSMCLAISKLVKLSIEPICCWTLVKLSGSTQLNICV